MSRSEKLLGQVLSQALCGKEAHVQATKALEELSWKEAGVCADRIPHTIFQLLNHMIYWQDWIVRWLDGENPRLPKRASMSWPGDVSPKNGKDWEQAVSAFSNGLEELERRCHRENLLAKRGRWSKLQMLQIAVLHNSYHLGQIVFLRRVLGSWPPPGGGDTW